MRKLILLLFLLFSAIYSHGQIHDIKQVRAKKQYTDIEMNALTYGLSDRVILFNTTQDSWMQWDGDSWETLGGTGGGSATFEYQTPITVNTAYNAGDTAINKVIPVDGNDITATINEGTWATGQVLFWEVRGSNFEVVAGTDARIYGIRNIDNEHKNSDPYTLIAIHCIGDNAGIMEYVCYGAKEVGYVGAVTTTSYSELNEGDTAVDVTVLGEGFSSNMETPIVTGNATLNSWTYIDNGEIRLNMTATGVANDQITVSYRNPDLTTDTNAITLGTPSLPTANLIRYYRLNDNTTDETGNGDAQDFFGLYRTGVSGNAAAFSSADYMLTPDAADLSHGNGTTDSAFSVTFSFYLDTLTEGKWLVGKRDDGGGGTDGNEYEIWVSALGEIAVLFYSQNNIANKIGWKTTDTLTTGQWYEIAITYDGSSTEAGIKGYIDGTEAAGYVSLSAGTYVAMQDTPQDVYFGTKPWATNAGDLDGAMDCIGIWNIELTASQVSGVKAKADAGLEVL